MVEFVRLCACGNAKETYRYCPEHELRGRVRTCDTTGSIPMMCGWKHGLFVYSWLYSWSATLYMRSLGHPVHPQNVACPATLHMRSLEERRTSFLWLQKRRTSFLCIPQHRGGQRTVQVGWFGGALPLQEVLFQPVVAKRAEKGFRGGRRPPQPAGERSSERLRGQPLVMPSLYHGC